MTDFGSLSLSPLFEQPPLLGPDAAEYAHLPLLAWLIGTLSAQEILLIDAGPSLRASAEAAIRQHDLPTRLHAARSATLTERPSSPSLGLVHLDLAHCEYPESLLASLAGCLAPDALIVVHGINAAANTGTWSRLSAGRPAFTFIHGSGLGLFAPGTVPAPASCLFTYDSMEDAPRIRLRNRFAFAGTRWQQEAMLRKQADHAAEQEKQALQIRREAAQTRAQLHAERREHAEREAVAQQAAAAARQDAEEAQALRAATQQRLEQVLSAYEQTSASLSRANLSLRQHNNALTEMRSALQHSLTALEIARHTAANLGERLRTAQQAQPELIASQAWQAQLLGELTARKEGLNALRSLLSSRGGLIRAFARTILNPNFVPFVPDLPELPAMPGPALPDLSRDVDAALHAIPPAIAVPEGEALLLPELPLLPAFEAPPPQLALPEPALPARHVGLHVLFIAGEPETPGVLYRCTRNAAACARAGHDVIVRDCAIVSPDELAWADIVILWRVEYSGHVHILTRLAREGGATLIFDTDDLVFLPALASVKIIDGIRTIGATEDMIHRTFSNMRQTMDRSDACFATTDALGSHMRKIRPLTFTVPNSFDALSLRRSRMGARHRQLVGEDGLTRIGYASGTRTHQRDFGVVVDVIARLLHQKPELRLVLFREAGNQRPVLLMEEFPSLDAVADQIEWRDMVSLPDLPGEMARFDISIAPLETGNVFCEAKSEIKFIEAALAGVPSVLSPTAPFRDAVTHGENALLAETPAEWEAALLTLIHDPALRQRMARNALNTVLWTFGPERQTLLFEAIMMGFGGDNAAARAAEIQLARGRYQGHGAPCVPDSEILFRHDAMDDAAITVIVTVYNYADHVIEALESVRAQTLACLDLVIVDDASTDDSALLVQDWARSHAERFNRLVLLRSVANSGLGGARNIGVSASETPYFLSLDADNRLLPDACVALLDTADEMTAYAWPQIRQFGQPTLKEVLGEAPVQPLQLRAGNYIDAMALVAKWAWAAAGGYYVKRDAMGWEDFDLWCRCTELGLKAAHLPRVVAEYRVHDSSMTNNVTERAAHKARVVTWIQSRHPWLDIYEEAMQRG